VVGILVFLIAAGISFNGNSSAMAAGTPAAPAMPADLNLASLRINALDTLYQLDLSPEQLHAMRLAAAGAASGQRRTAVKANAPLAQAMRDFQTALLTSKDDDAVAKLRNHVVELASDVELDDEVQPTDAAMAAAPGFCQQLKASQIAAYLALHADQVSDPVELIESALDAIRDTKAEAAANAAAEVDSLTTDAAYSAGYLVYGTDDAHAKQLEAQITAWLKASADLSDKDFAAQQATREESAKRLIGNVDPMVVLSHWLNLELSQVLANPELPTAIDAMLAAHPATN
jgi:hypothetical protein